MDPRIRIRTKMSWIRNTASVVSKPFWRPLCFLLAWLSSAAGFHGSTTLSLCPSKHILLSVHALLSPGLSLRHFGLFWTRRYSRQEYKVKIDVKNIRKISVWYGLAQSYGSFEFRTDPDMALDPYPHHWINLCVIDLVSCRHFVVFLLRKYQNWILRQFVLQSSKFSLLLRYGTVSTYIGWDLVGFLVICENCDMQDWSVGSV